MEFNQSKPIEMWRLLTYMFAHRTFNHFIGNAILLFVFSCWYEIEHGKCRLLAVTFFGCVGGCIGHAIVRKTNLIGASAAIWALIMANISSSHPNLEASKLRLIRTLLFICAGGDFYCEMIFPQQTKKSNPSHLGGASAGIFFEIIIATSKILIKRQ
jgi:membrane associated rhomboid family serine protease